MNGKKRLVLCLGVVLLSGCAMFETVRRDGFAVHKMTYQEAARNVRARFAFEHGCSLHQVQLVLLHAEGVEPKQIGARGCGKRAVYTRRRSGWGTGPELPRPRVKVVVKTQPRQE